MMSSYIAGSSGKEHFSLLKLNCIIVMSLSCGGFIASKYLWLLVTKCAICNALHNVVLNIENSVEYFLI